MRILVLGGTVFLSRAVAAEAAARGHDVTCAARGESGSVPEGARHVHLDRAAPDYGALTGDWDAVVDVSRTPGWVRDALDALAGSAAHWTFVSSISVYADHATPGGTPETTPLLEAITDDVEQDTPEKYGSSKVGCEQDVLERAAKAFVARPGLIVGPGDPSGRYTYWPERLADGGEVLAPGSPEDHTQVIDVRDLAAWVVDAAERGLTGVYDAVGPVTPIGEVLDQTAAGVDAAVELTWVDAGFLERQQVEPWSGPRSLPLWLPADHAGMCSHDTTAALAAGLRCRPIADTAADTLAWLRATPYAARTGLTREQERELLASWHSLGS